MRIKKLKENISKQVEVKKGSNKVLKFGRIYYIHFFTVYVNVYFGISF